MGTKFNKDRSDAFVTPSQHESIFFGNSVKVDLSRYPIRPNLVQFTGVDKTMVTCVSPQFPSDAVGQCCFRHYVNFALESFVSRRTKIGCTDQKLPHRQGPNKIMPPPNAIPMLLTSQSACKQPAQVL
jgi:hypothetical protein